MNPRTFNTRLPILPTPGMTDPRFTRLRFMAGDAGSDGTEGTDPADNDDADSTPPEGPADDDADDDADDEDEEFDLERARRKIRKANSENRNLRKAKEAAEQKAAGVDEKDARIKALEAENLRYRIGARNGLPDELIDRLKGNTEEEILEDAERLLALVAGRKAPSPRPREALRGGGAPDVEPEETDPRKLAARIPRR